MTGCAMEEGIWQCLLTRRIFRSMKPQGPDMMTWTCACIICKPTAAEFLSSISPSQ